MRVNGDDHAVADAWLGESLLYVLRERLGLPGAKAGCEQGECGSCSVLVDGALVCACLVLAAAAVGTEIVTVEGLQPEARGALTDVQRAFVDDGRGAVRVLHARAGHGGARPARPRPRADRSRGPRGDLRQPVPLHGLRPDPRGRRRSRSHARSGDAVVSDVDVGDRDGRGRDRRARDPARRHRQDARRVRVRRRPVGRRHAVGPARCARRTRRRASAAIDIGPALAHPRRARGAHRRRRAR